MGTARKGPRKKRKVAARGKAQKPKASAQTKKKPAKRVPLAHPRGSSNATKLGGKVFLAAAIAEEVAEADRLNAALGKKILNLQDLARVEAAQEANNLWYKNYKLIPARMRRKNGDDNRTAANVWQTREERLVGMIKRASDIVKERDALRRPAPRAAAKAAAQKLASLKSTSRESEVLTQSFGERVCTIGDRDGGARIVAIPRTFAFFELLSSGDAVPRDLDAAELARLVPVDATPAPERPLDSGSDDAWSDAARKTPRRTAALRPKRRSPPKHNHKFTLAESSDDASGDDEAEAPKSGARSRPRRPRRRRRSARRMGPAEHLAAWEERAAQNVANCPTAATLLDAAGDGGVAYLAIHTRSGTGPFIQDMTGLIRTFLKNCLAKIQTTKRAGDLKLLRKLNLLVWHEDKPGYAYVPKHMQMTVPRALALLGVTDARAVKVFSDIVANKEIRDATNSVGEWFADALPPNVLLKLGGAAVAAGRWAPGLDIVAIGGSCGIGTSTAAAAGLSGEVLVIDRDEDRLDAAVDAFDAKTMAVDWSTDRGLKLLVQAVCAFGGQKLVVLTTSCLAFTPSSTENNYRDFLLGPDPYGTPRVLYALFVYIKKNRLEDDFDGGLIENSHLFVTKSAAFDAAAANPFSPWHYTKMILLENGFHVIVHPKLKMPEVQYRNLRERMIIEFYRADPDETPTIAGL